MKTFCAVLFLLVNAALYAQVNVGGTINNKANEKTGQAIDAVWGAPGKVKDKKNDKQQSTSDTTVANTTTTQQNSNSTENQTPAAPAPMKVYQNYDFVAGSDLVFNDDFTGDMEGEFPAHWELESGQAVVNTFAGKKLFALTDGNYVKVHPRVEPNSYLDQHAWTMELDYYNQPGQYGLAVFLNNADGVIMEIHTASDGFTASFPVDDANTGGNSLTGSLTAQDAGDNFYNKWQHLAIAYKEGQLKVYLNQNRVLVVPNCHCKPTSVSLGGIGSVDLPLLFTNVRIANGGNQNMLNMINTTGKIVSYGITFDSGKSDLKPESMGTLNEIAKMLKENPAMKLEIGGYTDSDGDDASNMKLSQSRADAVRNQLISMGIDGSRLTAKGYGETRPIAPNTSFEGKAKNRRVEFLKQ